LRNGDTYTRLAAAWRYVPEAITLLAAAARDLDRREDPGPRRTRDRWPGSAAADAEPPRSGKPSSPCTASRPAAALDENVPN
jgi:hypothetical protein